MESGEEEERKWVVEEGTWIKNGKLRFFDGWE